MNRFALIVITGALALTGCGKKKLSEEEFYAYDSNARAAQVVLEIRVFDALWHGDTNMAKSLLAQRIDSELHLLELNSNQHPLQGASKTLCEDAVAYRRSSTELERMSGRGSTNVPGTPARGDAQ